MKTTHRIILGDALKVLKSIPDETIDLKRKFLDTIKIIEMFYTIVD